MSLVKYTNPTTDLFSRKFNDIIDDLFTTPTSFRGEAFMPSVDIAETEAEFEIAAELPGMKKEDIKVELNNGRLTISGVREFKAEENNKNYHRLETHYGSFTRSFYLPDSIDEKSVKAKYEDGILKVIVQKSEEKLSKPIKVM